MASLAVVIPTMNEEEFLPKLIESIKKQTRQPDEVVVADAGSTDRTVEIAQAAGFKVVAGGLPGPGRNAGAQSTTSELILFLDADVILVDPRCLEIAVKDFEEQKLGVATFDLQLVSGWWLQKFAHHVYNAFVRAWGRWNVHAIGACTLVRRSVHEAIRGYDPTVLFCEDNDYGKRANKVMPFGVINGTVIGVTNRRLKRDGGLKILAKYLLAELHIMFLGPIRHNWFKYEFGYKKGSNSKP